MDRFSATWVAISREAGIAAEHLAIGVTALGRANYAQPAYYGEAFFALSVGLERSAKLILVVDHLIKNGHFPVNAQVPQYGHRIDALIERLESIAQQRGLNSRSQAFPHSPIHDAILGILTKFADNATRYYNLDLVTGSSRVAAEVDPVSDWWNRVIIPILSTRPKTQLEKVAGNAQVVERVLRGKLLARRVVETGESVQEAFDLSLLTGLTTVARPHVQLSVLQYGRAIHALADSLSGEAFRRGLKDVPFLNEFYAIFANDDKYLRSRKTWSIYRR